MLGLRVSRELAHPSDKAEQFVTFRHRIIVYSDEELKEDQVDAGFRNFTGN